MTEPARNDAVVRYLLSFLLYGNEEAVMKVGYTRSEDEAKKYKINITPSLSSPLYDRSKTWRDFYPEVETALEGKQLPPDADILSLACFFVSNAEETVVPRRDAHGRLSAKDSVIGRHKLNMIPLVDEMARGLMKRLDLPAPTKRLSAVNLTHDIDTIAHYRHLRGALGGIYRGQAKAVRASLKDLYSDPAFTFPFILRQNSLLADKGNVRQLYFIKASGGKGFDYPQYNLYGKDFATLVQKGTGGNIGLHAAYNDDSLQRQKLRLEQAAGSLLGSPFTVSANRFHYLRLSNDRLQQLADCGITDDYSMSFADLAGFRLQTTRPVRWINPVTLQLTNLTLHPLTVMDCTLSNSNYMNLTEEEAYYTVEQLIDRTFLNAGELTLLWHNTSFEDGYYHRSLYPALLQYVNSLL